MRRLLLAVALLLWPSVCWAQGGAVAGPPNAILCNQTATFTGAAALTTISGATSTSPARVYVCGWHVTSTSSTTTTFQLETGTGTNCAGNAVVITPALNVTITAPSADHIDYAAWQTAQGGEVCVNAPATVNGLIYFSTF